MKKIIIFGSGIMAKIAHFYFCRDSHYDIVSFCTDRSYRVTNEFCGLPVVNFEDVEKSYPPDLYDMFIAVGPSKMNSIRELKFNEARKKGYKLATYKSPYSICDSAVGENTFIGDMAIIHPFVEVGENNLIWEYALLGNNCKIASHGYFSPRSTVSTFATVEDNVLLGTGSIIKTGVTVARKSLIGASCYISANTKENGVYGEKSSILYGCIGDKLDIS